MSYGAMDWAFEQPIKDAGEKFVLIAIAKHADENMQCYPSIARLAKLTGFSDSTVKLKLKALEKSGYLRVQRRTKNGKTTSNLYFLAGRESARNISDIYNINNNISLLVAESRLPSEKDELLQLAKLAMKGE